MNVPWLQHLFSCRNGYAPCDCLRRLWMSRWWVDLYGWPDHAAKN